MGKQNGLDTGQVGPGLDENRSDCVYDNHDVAKLGGNVLDVRLIRRRYQPLTQTATLL